MKRIVVKVGTNVLSQDNGLLDITTISHLVDQIVQLKTEGIEVILVSSGAVGAGRPMLKLSKNINKVVKRQVYSSIGQIKLMNTYSQLFQNYGLFCGQVLATKEDFRDRGHYVNMRNCFQALLQDKIVPIVNENDVVSVSELMFTDNDELAGLIASMINADALIILSNIDGVFDGHPDKADSQVVRKIEADDKTLLDAIAPTKSSFGRGGMNTKFRIAQKAAKVGINTYIGNGKKANTLLSILNGTFEGTQFVARKTVSNMKKWIAYNNLERKGAIYINKGAVDALKSTKQISSLLPIGVVKLKGEFKKGDLVEILNENGKAIGLGITQYGFDRAENYLGKKGKKALVHYDYLFLH